MTTHAAAISDLDDGPPINNCQGNLTFETSEVRDGELWNVFRCDACHKRVFADFYSRWWHLGERFTED
jgi:hypothetical protein